MYIRKCQSSKEHQKTQAPALWPCTVLNLVENREADIQRVIPSALCQSWMWPPSFHPIAMWSAKHATLLQSIPHCCCPTPSAAQNAAPTKSFRPLLPSHGGWWPCTWLPLNYRSTIVLLDDFVLPSFPKTSAKSHLTGRAQHQVNSLRRRQIVHKWAYQKKFDQVKQANCFIGAGCYCCSCIQDTKTALILQRLGT